MKNRHLLQLHALATLASFGTSGALITTGQANQTPWEPNPSDVKSKTGAKGKAEPNAKHLGMSFDFIKGTSAPGQNVPVYQGEEEPDMAALKIGDMLGSHGINLATAQCINADGKKPAGDHVTQRGFAPKIFAAGNHAKLDAGMIGLISSFASRPQQMAFA